jgi:hypothetical protein
MEIERATIETLKKYREIIASLIDQLSTNTVGMTPVIEKEGLSRH